MPVQPRLSPFVITLAWIVFTAVHSENIPPFARDIPIVKIGPPIFSFNGKDLSGFYTYTRDSKYEDPIRVFTVHDGMVHVSGQELGGVATRDSYSNYHLTVDWKWGNRTW